MKVIFNKTFTNNDIIREIRRTIEIMYLSWHKVVEVFDKNTGDSNYSSKHEQVFEFVSILKTDVKVLHTHLLNY